MDNISNKIGIYTENKVHIADGVIVFRDTEQIDIVVINIEQNKKLKELYAVKNEAKVILHFYNPVHGVFENSAVLNKYAGNRFSFIDIQLLGNVQRREFVKVKLKNYVNAKTISHRRAYKPKTRHAIHNFGVTRVGRRYKVGKLEHKSDFPVVIMKTQVCIEDISAGGVMISADKEFSINDQLSFRFEKSRVPLNLRAMILRKQIVKLREYKYGCKFVQISEPDVAMLCEYIYKRQMEIYKSNQFDDD